MPSSVRDDAYDKLPTPFTFAYTQSGEGVMVDMLSAAISPIFLPPRVCES